MANIIPTAFKTELLSGTHNFANGGNTFKLALYTDITGFSASSTAYSTTGEVSTTGTNYSAKGNALDGQAVAATGTTAHATFSAETFSSVSLTAVGAAIINTSASDKLCLVLDFGGSKTATNGDFIVQFPTANATDAILRIA
tara:strand:+ start:99 stop:524 length:426 start_codon:yes stop_codon:yes gene_type:complete